MNNSKDRLSRALASGREVTIERRLKDADDLSGYVVLMSGSWVVINIAEDTWLDGYTALPLRHVTKVRTKPADAFTTRALKHYGIVPQTPLNVNFDDMQKLIVSASESFGVVTLFAEKRYPQQCHIGAAQNVDDRRIELLEINPRAEWEQETTSWQWRKITRIDFGRRYEQALMDLSKADS